MVTYTCSRKMLVASLGLALSLGLVACQPQDTDKAPKDTKADKVSSTDNSSASGSTDTIGSMDDAIAKARGLAVQGGNVILSPACASFDMFSDYEQRGRVFKEIVQRLS